jgi:hypothetical protein
MSCFFSCIYSMVAFNKNLTVIFCNYALFISAFSNKQLKINRSCISVLSRHKINFSSLTYELRLPKLKILQLLLHQLEVFFLFLHILAFRFS